MKILTWSFCLFWLCSSMADGGAASLDVNDVEMKAAEKTSEYTIFTGQLKEQRFIPNVQFSGCLQDKDSVCLNNFFVYRIKIDEVIVGELNERFVTAAKYQHGKYLYRGSQTAVFVIEHIKEKNWHELLGTEYELHEYAQIMAEHCLLNPARKYINVLSEADQCYQLFHPQLKKNPVADTIRAQVFTAVVDQVETELQQRKVLLSVNDSLLSDGQKIIDTEDQEYRCQDVDMDRYDRNRDCIFSRHHNLIVFTVSQGKGDEAKASFKKVLEASRLNLKPFDIRYYVIEHDDYSEFQVHYQY